MDAEVKQVFVKSNKTAPESAPKKITKSRRVLPKAKPAAPVARKISARAHRTYPIGVLKGTRQTRKAKLEPTNRDAREGLVAVQKALAEHKLKEKSLFAHMFDSKA